jgi:hypothetical protein
MVQGMQAKGRSSRQKRQKTSAITADDAVTAGPASPLPWPETYTGKLFPSTHLLGNTDDLIWNALAHVDPSLFNKKGKEEQDVALRVALSIIGVGWVATNPTPSRIARSGFYKAAKDFYMKNGWRAPKGPLPKITGVDLFDRELIGDCGHIKYIDGQSYVNERGEWDFTILNTSDGSSNPAFPLIVAQKINHNLQQNGMDVIRGAVDNATIATLRTGAASEASHPDARQLTETGGSGRLLHTSGNGVAGEEIFHSNLKTQKKCGSYYSDLQKSKYFDRLQSTIVRSLLQPQASSDNLQNKQDTTNADANATNIADKRKCILLKYSKGGENWAHCDSNVGDEFPYQALLMLSCVEEYDGGEFYVAKQIKSEGNATSKTVTISRLSSPKLNAGDLVIFRADKGFDHGMKTVTRGERTAVGLLQAIN